ncbi:helix-turn-helix transcriptional regulator [Burkholderia ubonensis]|uniref:S24 family peptidase n=1 Tax=Burkholderia ubonensis TaxID=101571 RepID=UPI0009B3B81D|nr:S24 family peptidase [Burkholderia ubonensis]
MNEIELNHRRVALLRAAIDKIDGGNVTAFGRRLGYKDGAFIRQMLSERRTVSEKTIRAVESLPGMIGWFNDHSSLPLQSDVKRLPQDQGNVLPWDKPTDLPPDHDRVWLDRYDYRFSAGNGLVQWEIRQKKALPFEIGFFKTLGIRPQDCKLASVHGRSMEPYLFHRDLMMICETRTRVKDGLIYAIIFEEEPLVKQIFKEPNGSLRLHSYNTDFPDRIVPTNQLDRLQIVGEVMYRSGSGPAGGN